MTKPEKRYVEADEYLEPLLADDWHRYTLPELISKEYPDLRGRIKFELLFEVDDDVADKLADAIIAILKGEK